MIYKASDVPHIPGRRLKRLLRARGYTLTRVGKTMTPPRSQALISRVVFKQARSRHVNVHIAKILNGKPINEHLAEVLNGRAV
jgi:hypothetical protein